MGELERVLYLGELLLDGPRSSAELQGRLGVSLASLRRAVVDLRHLGGQVEAVSSGKGVWVYRLANGPQIESTLRTWLRLERLRDLTTPL